MRELWVILTLLTAVIAIREWARLQRRRVRRRLAFRPPRPRGRASSFNAPAWQDVAGQKKTNLHRPAEIELTKTEILPPPRRIDGRYVE